MLRKCRRAFARPTSTAVGFVWLNGVPLTQDPVERWPLLTLKREHGPVEVWSFGGRRFVVKAGGHEQDVVGFEETQEVARKLAAQLD